MTNREHYRKLENMMHSAPFVRLVGAKVSVNKGEAQITLPVRKELYHAAGAIR